MGSRLRRVLKLLAAGAIVSVVCCVLVVAIAAVINIRTPPDGDLSQSRHLAEPPARVREVVQLKIATFNVWGILGLSSNRPERMRAIGHRLAELKVDLVGFQEAFVESDRGILATELARAGLLHSHYFPSGSFGSGLFIVSRFPIEEVFFRRFTRGGYWYKFQHGDWWVGKGIALARVALPGGGYLDLFNTHAVADYGEARYRPVQLSNVQDILGFIEQAASGTSPVIALGDFNVKYPERAYQHLVEQGRLKRLMALPSRLDHIFARPDPAYTFEVLDTVELNDYIDVRGESVHLSDHPGYVSTVRMSLARP